MPLTFHYTTGLSLYARFDNASNTAVNFTEGSSLNVGLYTASDSAITTASLPARATPYSGRIFIGTAGAQANTDVQVGEFTNFYWSGSAEGSLTSVVGRKLLKYDAAPVGNLKSTFTRSVATVDDCGRGVSANTRRFSSKDHSICGYVDWQDSGVDAGTNCNLFMTGPDIDGTPLLVYVDNNAGTLKVATIDDDAMRVSVVSSTAFSSFPGTGGGTTYSPHSARIIGGTIVVLNRRILTGPIYEGVTIMYSQDRGVTWTRVENSTGGTYDVPKPTAYGTALDNCIAGREWAMGMFSEGGLDEDGNYDKNDWWICWTDYRGNTGTTPKGMQFGTFRMTRSSETDHFTVHKNRVLYERFDNSASANFHGHSLGLTGDGLFVAANGDTSLYNSLVAIEIDHDTYETASPTVTTDWFGSVTGVASTGQEAPQISMFSPGPGGTIIGSNDTWPSPLLRIGNAATASDACELDGPLWAQSDATSGVFYAGWDNIFLGYYPGVGYTLGGFGSTTYIRHISYDGENWAALNNVDGFEGPFLLTPKCMLTVRSSDEVIMIAKQPVIKTVKPLLIAPGGDNLLTSVAAPDIGVAPSSTNTLSAVLWNGSRFVYNTGGADVANAPKVPAPLVNPMYLLLGCESTSSSAHGVIYTQASGQTMTIGSNIVGVQAYACALGPSATGYVTHNVGVAGATNDRNPDRGYKLDQMTKWLAVNNFGDPINNPTAARGAMGINGGSSASYANPGCPILLAIGGVFINQQNAPYPTARLSTSNPVEVERVFLPSTTSVRWSTFITVFRPEFDTTIGSAMPSGYIATVYADANNYVQVYLDGANYELEITPTVAGVGGSTTTIACEHWLRGGGWVIGLSDNGVDLEISVLHSRNGILTGTNSGGSLKLAPTEVRLTNYNMSSVINTMIGGVDHRDEYLTAQQRQDVLQSLDCLSSDVEIAAVEFADKVKSELAGTLHDLDVLINTRSTQVSVDDVPTTAEFEARTLTAASYATSSALASSESAVLSAIGAIDVTADVTVNNPQVNVELCD